MRHAQFGVVQQGLGQCTEVVRSPDQGAVTVVVGDHQVVGDDHDVVEGDEVFADGVGEGLS